MSDTLIRIEGAAGRITLNRPKALNAVTWDMVRDIDAALRVWAGEDAVKLIIIDGAGERAFAAGGDITDLYKVGRAGDFAFGRRFWAEEYRMNLRIARYPKPVVSLMHGFTMGGGVGLSCHAAHRIVDETVQIAMPECGIGLIPDVGGTWLLAHVPDNLGYFLGLTGHRMGPGDAIYAGFADTFVPRKAWPELITALCKTGEISTLPGFAQTAPAADLPARAHQGGWYDTNTLAQAITAMEQQGSEAASQHLKALRRQSPLAAVCGFAAIKKAQELTLEQAFTAEYRFVWRATEHGDFLEGIRAQVIDKDRTPIWRHKRIEDVPTADAVAMSATLGADELRLEEELT